MSKLKRKRGVVLTPEGLQKFQEVRLESEYQENFGQRYTLEQLSDRTNLDLHTIKRVIACKQGVDKRSIERLFLAFNLDLKAGWYSNPDPNQRHDWGEAISVSLFYGRTKELVELEKWLLNDRCRLVTILGMGGVGKTSLSVKLAEQIQNKFDCIIWRSLRDAPPVKDILTTLIQFLSDEQETEADLPESISEKISRLIEYLRSSRCLLVLDNAESLLRGGSRAGLYREGYEGYGELFKRIGESDHQSSLLLTTREKPKEIASLEGETLPVRTLRLKGFKEGEGQEILKMKGLSGSDSEFKVLSDRYTGNALALNIVATTIRDLFEGNIAEFLRQDAIVFGDIRDLLDQQFDRTSALEKELVCWLAINREPVSVSQLRDDLVLPVPPQKLLEELESLSRRSLIEQNAACFSLQPVVMEYVTSRLVERVCQEIVSEQPQFFRSHALIKAQAKDYVRETQIRLILLPVIDGLFALLKSQKDIEDRLTQILVSLQQTSPLEPGYIGGNIINLLCQLGTDLNGYDFSNLSVWQADLRNTLLHDVNFQNADLAKSVFAETSGGILSVAFSPDGKILATGDSNGEICWRQVSDGKQLFTCKGHANWIVSLAFHPDGCTLASSSTDCTIKLWDAATGQCLQTLHGHENEVWSVAFSPDGNTLASGSDDYTIRLWLTSTGECLTTLRGNTNHVLAVAFSPDGKTLASGGADNKIGLWDLKTSQCLKNFSGHSNPIRAIAFSPDGQKLVSSSEDYTVKLWEVSTGQCLKTFQGHSNQVFSVAFNPQGNLLVSGSHDRTVKLWNVGTGQCLKTFQGHSSWIFSVAFHPQGDLLASGSYDQTVKLWNVSTGQCLKTFQGHTNQIFAIAFSPDGQTLISGGQDRIVRLWNVSTGQILRTFQGHRAAVRSVDFSPNGQILASGSHDQTVRLWDVNTGQVLRTCQGHQAMVWSVAFSPDGQMVASSSEDQTIRLWDIGTGQVLRIFQGHRAAIWSVAFHPQGRILASGALDRTIKLWDVSSGECLRTLEKHNNWVWAVAFSSDGNMLVSTSLDGTLKLWDISTGECLKVLSVNAAWLQSIAFSSDSQMLASSSQDYTVRLWDVSTGKCLEILPKHTGWIWSVAFSPNNQILASSSEDETIKLWNLKTGDCLKTFNAENPYERMNLIGVRGLTQATITTLKALGAVN
ncbi:MAG: NB-ARC domain-containing protein [Hydrococcus sp. Prado102]|jgi:WD40 repeat protein|nr:NB-ARC domain-containing protein [Hydrococcus sp. Prado102]